MYETSICMVWLYVHIYCIRIECNTGVSFHTFPPHFYERVVRFSTPVGIMWSWLRRAIFFSDVALVGFSETREISRELFRLGSTTSARLALETWAFEFRKNGLLPIFFSHVVSPPVGESEMENYREARRRNRILWRERNETSQRLYVFRVRSLVWFFTRVSKDILAKYNIYLFPWKTWKCDVQNFVWVFCV